MYRSAVVVRLTSDPNSGPCNRWRRGCGIRRIWHDQVYGGWDAHCRAIDPVSCDWHIVRHPVHHIPIGVTRGERIFHVDQTVRHVEDVYTVVPVTDLIA